MCQVSNNNTLQCWNRGKYCTCTAFPSRHSSPNWTLKDIQYKRHKTVYQWKTNWSSGIKPKKNKQMKIRALTHAHSSFLQITPPQSEQEVGNFISHGQQRNESLAPLAVFMMTLCRVRFIALLSYNTFTPILHFSARKSTKRQTLVEQLWFSVSGALRPNTAESSSDLLKGGQSD